MAAAGSAELSRALFISASLGKTAVVSLLVAVVHVAAMRHVVVPHMTVAHVLFMRHAVMSHLIVAHVMHAVVRHIRHTAVHAVAMFHLAVAHAFVSHAVAGCLGIVIRSAGGSGKQAAGAKRRGDDNNRFGIQN
jgi:ABC-type transport system involved in Fe-S cluster assembly fused permease/ATPase subunit